jgi:plasmid stabilization system protein ParE
MSLKLKFRGRARRDLQALVAFIAETNGDFLVARRVGKRLVNRCRKLVRAPIVALLSATDQI